MRTLVDRPNIMLCVFDSLGTDELLARLEHLPNLKALQTQGVWFPKAYCGCPESGPARASLLTGLDMAAHGVWTDGVTLPSHTVTMAEQFRSSGYQTWLFGRRQLAGVSNWTTEHTRAHEFNYAEWAHGPLHRSRQNAYLKWLQSNASAEYAELFPSQPDPDNTHIPPWQCKAMDALANEFSFNHWVGSQLSERIREHTQNNPFFAMAGFVVGETLGGPPLSGTINEQVNLKALQQADAAIGELLIQLNTTQLSDNTIVVIASARGSMQSTSGENSLREETIKVPLIVTGKELTAHRIDSLVSTIDIAPTLYELATVPAPQRIQGGSLLTGKPRGWALCRLRHPDHPRQTALCTEKFKLIAHHPQPERDGTEHFSLYDLQQDPTQKNNLAAVEEYQEELENMIDLMIDARVALEDRTEPRIAKF